MAGEGAELQTLCAHGKGSAGSYLNMAFASCLETACTFHTWSILRGRTQAGKGISAGHFALITADILKLPEMQVLMPCS